ncbi:MFS transporter [Legionella taurinensis]|uniref:MFS transporter n=1 Tax=Legionella taurinensis TaxID=70611 RepID=A0AB38N2Q0_9GAMM|nr:MFS transporter [Legionella taurinensis]MDX1837978.1 MFS transporter [Legionella taurinensis]PUT39434.1 MFS transporter [Legionella taurinensis]PUT41742.1 MFS transporter [Legionella taurinensis]PUT44576.1 MFS transporter [Legionella taurinensis]PUT46821.1 MFS transporter [Legionella taurinensis]
MISTFRLIWLLSYITTASVSAAVITPGLPAIADSFQLNIEAIQWMISAFLGGYVIGQLIYGPLANRVGRVGALRVGLVINLLGLLVCYAGLLFHSYGLLIGGRLVSALGAASGLSCTLMLINEWLPEQQRRTALSYSILAFTLGIGLAVSLGGWIVTYWQWQGCFALLFIHGVLLLAGTPFLKETMIIRRRVNLAQMITAYRQTLASPGLVVYALAVGFCSAIGYCYSAAGPLIAERFLHLSAAAYGSWNLVNMLGMLMGGLLTKRLLQRCSPQRVVVYGFGGCTLALLGLFLMWQLHWLLPIGFFIHTSLLYLFSGFLFAGGSCLATASVQDKSNGSAMLSFINMLTATLAVIVMGYTNTNPWLGFVEIILLFGSVIAGAFLLFQHKTGASLRQGV